MNYEKYFTVGALLLGGLLPIINGDLFMLSGSLALIMCFGCAAAVQFDYDFID